MARNKKKITDRRKYCPSCGSSQIKMEIPQNWSVYKCWDCGWVGPLVIEGADIAAEIRKDYLKRTGKSD